MKLTIKQKIGIFILLMIGYPRELNPLGLFIWNIGTILIVLY